MEEDILNYITNCHVSWDTLYFTGNLRKFYLTNGSRGQVKNCSLFRRIKGRYVGQKSEKFIDLKMNKRIKENRTWFVYSFFCDVLGQLCSGNYCKQNKMEKIVWGKAKVIS